MLMLSGFSRGDNPAKSFSRLRVIMLLVPVPQKRIKILKYNLEIKARSKEINLKCFRKSVKNLKNKKQIKKSNKKCNAINNSWTQIKPNEKMLNTVKS